MTELADIFSLSAQDEWQMVESWSDEVGMSHMRCQQKHEGVPIEGAIYLFHSDAYGVRKANGQIVRDIKRSNEPRIDRTAAIEAAITYVDAPSYYWQDAEKERLIKLIDGDESATFYPAPELVYVDKSYSTKGSDYRLAWKMEIAADGIDKHQIVFVDAIDGHILFTQSGCYHAHVIGTAETRYHGIQQFSTDSIAPDSFVLFDETRCRIYTYDNLNYESGDVAQAQLFVDDDNYWDHDNARFDNAATDAHWGMQMFYDYYAERHNRLSYDNQNSPMISYIHVSNGWSNATWSGRWANFGDGNRNPLTSIDVVAHEFTHGVTRHSANLIYQGESGALNESFSDIFGLMVKHYAIPDQFSWRMGAANYILRDMSKPKVFGDPNTYKGENWHFESSDNGGVHTNSGVQNFWFYLLSEGGSGVNDLGHDYAVDSLGKGTAAQIAYRNLTTYLTPNATYEDARMGAIWASEDLYGACSHEVRTTIAAWYAVGLGSRFPMTDISNTPLLSLEEESCDYSDAQPLVMSLKHVRSGCIEEIPAGTWVYVGCRDGSDTIAFDSFQLLTDWIQDSVITYTFDQTLDMTRSKFYDIEFFHYTSYDLIESNNISPTQTFASLYTIDSTWRIHFDEFVRPVKPSYWTESERYASLTFGSEGRYFGIRGAIFRGENSSLEDLNLPFSEEQNFAINNTYESRLCMCMDGTGWDSISVSFYLRQGVSFLYDSLDTYYLDSAQQHVALQLIVDGVPVSPQYHPKSYNSDPFERQNVDLSAYIDQSFNLCFRGKHYVARAADLTSTVGDYSHLDQIDFHFVKFTSVEDVEDRRSSSPNPLLAYPNPAQDHLILRAEPNDDIGDIVLYNIQGQEVMRRSISSNYEILSLQGLDAGVYLLNRVQDDQVTTQKIVLSK